MTGDIRQSIVERIESYLDTWRTGDLDARRRLFSPKGMLEDPVGGTPVEGGPALAAHWTHLAKEGASYEAQLKRVSVAGHEALAVALVKTVPAHGPAIVTELFALFEFDRALEIRRLRIFRDDSCTHLAS